MCSIRCWLWTLDLAQSHNGPIICAAHASKDYSERLIVIVSQGIRTGLSGNLRALHTLTESKVEFLKAVLGCFPIFKSSKELIGNLCGRLKHLNFTTLDGKVARLLKIALHEHCGRPRLRRAKFEDCDSVDDETKDDRLLLVIVNHYINKYS